MYECIKPYLAAKLKPKCLISVNCIQQLLTEVKFVAAVVPISFIFTEAA